MQNGQGQNGNPFGQPANGPVGQPQGPMQMGGQLGGMPPDTSPPTPEQDNQLTGIIAEEAAQNPPETPEGKKFLSDITAAEQQATLNKSSQFYNLAQELDDGLTREIGQEILNGYRDDDESRSEWLEMHENWLRLYMQTDYALNSDPERSWGATESVPILTEACDQFQSRTYKAFFPSEGFVSCTPETHTDNPMKAELLRDRAERVGRHMSWQLGVQNKNYKRDKRALFLGVAVHGSFFTKTYFDAYKKKRPCIDNVRPTDLVVNYTCGRQAIEDLRRKTHIIRMSVGETETLAAKQWLTQAARAGDEEGYTEYDEAVDDSQGLTPSNGYLKKDKGCVLLEQQLYLDINDAGYPIPYLGTIDSGGRLLRLVIDYEADMNGMPLKDYEQIQYYTHYKYMENPDGFYGLGLGAKIGDLNSAVNIGLRQALDAATLANDGNNSGYISSRLCMDGEEQVTLTLGRLKKIPDTTGDISNGISLMKFPGPNAAHLQILEMMDARAQRMSGTTEATTGSIEKNQQPTTVLAQIEQAMEQFSSVQVGLSDDFGDELSKIYKLNSKYLPFTEYYTINDVSEAITRADYQEDMAVNPIFDPKFATRAQKVAKAQAELQATMQNPLSQMRPQVYDIAFRRYLEALDTDNIDELIPPTPMEQLIAFAQSQAAGQQPGAQGPSQPGGNAPMGGRPGNGVGGAPAPSGLSTPGGVVPAQNGAGGGGSQFMGGIVGSA